MTDQQQDARIDPLQKNGVKTVRTGIGNRYNRFIFGPTSTALVPWLCDELRDYDLEP